MELVDKVDDPFEKVEQVVDKVESAVDKVDEVFQKEEDSKVEGRLVQETWFMHKSRDNRSLKNHFYLF